MKRLLAAVALLLMAGNAHALDIRGGAGGSAGAAGTSCWDLNANGTCDAATEDSSGNGTCEALDCKGAPGEAGSAGAEGAPGVPGLSANQILSGGGIAYTGSGMDIIVSAVDYIIAGTAYSAAQTPITLTAADGDFDRIDLIVADTAGAISVIDGTPATPAAKPTHDPATQIELGFIHVAADATTPSNITTEIVYAEHSGEWGTNASGNWDADNTTNPRSGTKAVRANAAAIGSLIRFNKTGGVDLGIYNTLIVYIRIDSWPNNKNLIVQALNSGGTAHGTAVLLVNNSLGLNPSNTTDYQQVVIPVSAFAANGLDTRYLRFQVSGSGGGSLSLRLDDISFQGGVQQTSLGTAYMQYRQTWSASANYLTNQVVIYQGQQYIALQNSTNVTPGSSATTWQKTVTAISGNAGTATALAAGANLSYGGKLTITGISAISADTAAGASDRIISCTSGSDDDETYTLPAATGTGRVIDVVKIDSGTNACIVGRAGSDTLNGATTRTLADQYDADTCIDIASALWLCRGDGT